MTAPQRSRLALERAVALGVLVLVGGYAFVESFEYGWFNEGNRVGPGLLPAVTGGLVALVAAVLIVGTFRDGRSEGGGLAKVAEATLGEAAGPAENDGSDDDVDIFGRTAAQRNRQLAVVTVALVVALVAVPVVGLLVALGLFSLFVSIVVERRPWLPSILITVVAVAAVYGVFAVFLEVPLPTGYLGIGG